MSESTQDITSEQFWINLWQFSPSKLQFTQNHWDRKCLGSTCQGKSKLFKLSPCSNLDILVGHQFSLFFTRFSTELTNWLNISIFSVKITTGSFKKIKCYQTEHGGHFVQIMLENFKSSGEQILTSKKCHSCIDLLQNYHRHCQKWIWNDSRTSILH